MNTIFEHALWVSPLFWTLILLGAAIILFVHNKIRMDVVALLVMLSFYLSGIDELYIIALLNVFSAFKRS